MGPTGDFNVAPGTYFISFSLGVTPNSATVGVGQNGVAPPNAFFGANGNNLNGSMIYSFPSGGTIQLINESASSFMLVGGSNPPSVAAEISIFQIAP